MNENKINFNDLPEKLHIIRQSFFVPLPSPKSPFTISIVVKSSKIRKIISGLEYIGIVSDIESSVENKNLNGYKIGACIKINDFQETPDNTVHILGVGVTKFIIDDKTSDPAPIPVKYIFDDNNEEGIDKQIEKAEIQVEKFYKILEETGETQLRQALPNSLQGLSPGELANALILYMSSTLNEQQTGLEIMSVKKRLEFANQLAEKAITQGEKIKNTKSQIKNSNPKIATILEKLNTSNTSPKIREIILEETNRLQTMPPTSSEANIVENYINTLLRIPYEKSTSDSNNLHTAQQTLNKHHTGLDKIKERILEFIAVKKLNPSSNGSILCFIGPPGTGKTSIAQSIGKALGRKTFRFSVGGMKDETEIKGHRRTYLGALPGKIIRALTETGVDNPVIILDEIDKIGNNILGDPSSALLEALDPEQNSSFRDHYLDTEVNLSKVLFIATANTDEIQPALLDRMETITLSAYTTEEKLKIAKNHLIPKLLESNGLSKKGIGFRKNAILHIITLYTLEAGVRKLEEQIKKICRKIAVKIAEDSFKPCDKIITPTKVEHFLGKHLVRKKETSNQELIGVSTGLAYTSAGGDTLSIQAIKIPGKKNKVTGQLGDVMVESIEVARSLVSSELNGKDDFNPDQKIHLHVPAGATPKDGPSAGTAIATALYSLHTGKKIPENIAMTGEITLTGSINSVGGIKEKLTSAYNQGVKTILIPKDNVRDLDELTDEVRSGLTIHPVSHFKETLKHLNLV